MTDHKEGSAPSGLGAIHAQPPQSRRERVQVKCSTCAKRKCRERYMAVDWRHCGMWRPKLEDTIWAMSSQDGCGGCGSGGE